MDTLNCGVGTRVQRRENVGGSLNLWSPRDVFTSVIGFCPFDDLEYSTLKSIRQVFCQKNFLYYWNSYIPRKWSLLFCPDFWNKINTVSDEKVFLVHNQEGEKNDA